MSLPRFITSLSFASLAFVLGACPGTIAQCECIPDDPEEYVDGGAPEPSQPECGVSSCGTVLAIDDGEGFMLANTNSLDCALEALRDRTPGIVRWNLRQDGGQYTDQGYILIREDGTAAGRTWGAQDLAFIVEDAQGGELADPSYFEGCLEKKTDKSRFDCLSNTRIKNGETCDEGWFIDYGI